MKDIYALKGGILTIQDQELEISIMTPYSPQKVPKNWNPLPNLVLKKHSKGWVEQAYFQVEQTLEGQFVSYYSNGSVASDCYYHRGELHGPSRLLSEEGICLSESWYEKGKKQGKVRRWFLSGKLASIQRYKEGALHGRQEFYEESGLLRTELYYQRGQLDGEVRLFWPSGAKKRVVSFFKGKRQGLDQMWGPEGESISQEGDPKREETPSLELSHWL